MKKTRKITLLIALSILLFSVAATQLLAYRFIRFGSGELFFGFFHPPYSFIFWTKSAFSQNPLVVFQIYTVAFLLAFFLVVFLLNIKIKSKQRTTHGSSRWAVREDLVDAGLLGAPQNEHSLIVGGWNNKGKVEYLVHSGPESILVNGPSRSGKGVALVNPNLLSYESSVFAVDRKKELWRDTSGWRQRCAHNVVMYHDPSDEGDGNAQYNALEEVRINTSKDVSDAQNIAVNVIWGESNTGKEKDDHWVLSSRRLVTGLILHALYKSFFNKAPSPGLSDILASISDPEKTNEELFTEMTTFPHCSGSPHKAVAQIGASMLDKSERELTSVVSTAISKLDVFQDSVVAKATSRSDFKVMDLVEHEKPVTLYLIIPPSESERLKGYFAMFISMVCRRLTEKLPDKNSNRRWLLLMLDEFSSLPAIPVVHDSLDIFSGYRIHSMIVVQDYQRLVKLYGKEETISANCKVFVAYPPNKIETAEMLSKATGSTTVEEQFRNKSGERFSLISSKVSQSASLYSRPLLTADEVKRLPVPKIDENDRMVEPGAALILPRGCFPVLGVQTPFFFDEVFVKRASHPAPEFSDSLCH